MAQDITSSMEILKDISEVYADLLPIPPATKADIKLACNNGISALKTIDDLKNGSQQIVIIPRKDC